MTYQAELEFFKKLLNNFHLTYVIITPDMKALPDRLQEYTGCMPVMMII